MRSIISPLNQDNDNTNPLDQFEEVLEASNYTFDRLGENRIHFKCHGNQSDYTVMLDRNADANIVKLGLVIAQTQSCDKSKLDHVIMQANESAWHGFFMVDGVGNTIFKALIQCDELSMEVSLFLIQDMIDQAMKEADRFYITLAITNDNGVASLFQNEDHDVDRLNLLFSDIKGNA